MLSKGGEITLTTVERRMGEESKSARMRMSLLCFVTVAFSDNQLEE